MATARVAIAVQAYAGLPELGVQLTEAAADNVNGNRWDNTNGNTILVARNSSGGALTSQFTYHRRGQQIQQTAVNLAAGKSYVFGPLPPEMGDHPSADVADQNVYVTASAATVLFSALQLPGLRPS